MNFFLLSNSPLIRVYKPVRQIEGGRAFSDGAQSCPPALRMENHARLTKVFLSLLYKLFEIFGLLGAEESLT